MLGAISNKKTKNGRKTRWKIICVQGCYLLVVLVSNITERKIDKNKWETRHGIHLWIAFSPALCVLSMVNRGQAVILAFLGGCSQFILSLSAMSKPEKIISRTRVFQVF